MRQDRLRIASFSACVVFSLMTGCHSHNHHDQGRAADRQEKDALTTAIRAVIASKFWRSPPTEVEIEKIVETIAHQPADSIVFLGADGRVHTMGPGSAESYRTAEVKTVSFPDGIDPRSIKIDLRDSPNRGRAEILTALAKILAEEGPGSPEDPRELNPQASKYEYTLLFDRDRLRAYGVELDDIRGALTEQETVRVEPENPEGILIEVRLPKAEADDPQVLMDRVLVTVQGRPVTFRDVALFRQKLLTEAAPAK